MRNGALGVFFAIRVPETGILLTLAFDVLFAALLVPFVLGLWWPLANRSAALAAIFAGTATRLVLFALIPTTFGTENTLLYFPNEVFTASFDGLPTFISPLVGLTTYFVVTLATTGAFVPERTAPAVPAAPYSKNGRVLSGPIVRFRSVPRSS